MFDFEKCETYHMNNTIKNISRGLFIYISEK